MSKDTRIASALIFRSRTRGRHATRVMALGALGQRNRQVVQLLSMTLNAAFDDGVIGIHHTAVAIAPSPLGTLSPGRARVGSW
jgi:hypothetical protein